METMTGITGKAKLAGVIGWPVAHSLSPALHGSWLQRYNIDGAYVPLPVAPEDLQAVVSLLPKMGFSGVNLTLPHKEAVLALADELEDSANAIGAANTLVFSDGRIIAANTDAFGFAESLREQLGAERAGKKEPALILGAGGAARAVIYALQDMGKYPIRVSNRSAERVEALKETFPFIESVVWAEKETWLPDTGLLVNTTSCGMHGKPPLDINMQRLNPHAAVADIVYQPLQTALLKQAMQQGNPVVDGLGMLLHQAREGFRRWFAIDPEVDSALRHHLLAVMEKSA